MSLFGFPWLLTPHKTTALPGLKLSPFPRSISTGTAISPVSRAHSHCEFLKADTWHTQHLPSSTHWVSRRWTSSISGHTIDYSERLLLHWLDCLTSRLRRHLFFQEYHTEVEVSPSLFSKVLTFKDHKLKYISNCFNVIKLPTDLATKPHTVEAPHMFSHFGPTCSHWISHQTSLILSDRPKESTEHSDHILWTSFLNS